MMRIAYFFLIFCLSSSLYSTDISAEIPSNPSSHDDLRALILPPMPVPTQLPVSLSYENKKELNNASIVSNQRMEMEESLAEKNPPWFMLVSIAAVLIAIAIIRSSGDKSITPT